MSDVASQKDAHSSAAEIVPRVRHLEAEVGDLKTGQRQMFDKLDLIAVALASLQANKPINIGEGLRTSLQVLQTLVLMVGAAVASIVYVSSNANNASLAVLHERQAVFKDRLGQVEAVGWATRTSATTK